MARKATPEKTYIEAMETMLDDGLRIEEITATKLQKLVGGQYSKIIKIVEGFKDGYLEKKEVEKTAPMSPWFKSVIENVTESVANQLTESWFTINSEITSSVALASEAFEEKKAEYEAKAIEDLEQIKSLESDNEQLASDYDGSCGRTLENDESGETAHSSCQKCCFKCSSNILAIVSRSMFPLLFLKL